AARRSIRSKPQGGCHCVNMLVCTGGRQRSEAEFRRLFAAAGLVLPRIITTDVPFASILEGVREWFSAPAVSRETGEDRGGKRKGRWPREVVAGLFTNSNKAGDVIRSSRFAGLRGRFEIGCQACSSSSSALASFKSSMSKPSVNQPYTGASSS